MTAARRYNLWIGRAIGRYLGMRIMFQTRLGSASALIAVTSISSPMAIAQVDHRIDHRVDDGAGRLLDRNPQVGQGRANPVPSRRFDGGARANAIITGNLTGLGRFHVSSPVLQNNQFRAALPSAGLSRFLSTSVGMNQIRSRQVLRPTIYLGRQETVPDLGFIRRGLTEPGSSRLVTPLTRPPMPRLPLRQEDLLNVPSDLTSGGAGIDAGRSPNATIGTGALGAERLFPSSYDWAVGSSLFGSPPPSGPELTVAGLPRRSPAPRLGGLGDRPGASRTVSGGRVGATGPIDLDAKSYAVDSEFSRLELLAPAADESADNVFQANPPGEPRGSDFQPHVFLSPVTDEGSVAFEVVGDFEGPGADRFSDLYRAVMALEKVGLRRLGYLSRRRAGGAERTSGTDVGAAAVTPSPEDQAVAALASAARWARARLDEPIKTFVGGHESPLNRYLAAAEAYLQRDEYYRAAQQYELAHAVDPENPLPLLGRGHALAAAGDYLSAVLAIERGIMQFPHIAAFRLDLPTLTGRADVFDIRRADLETRLAASESLRLRFLLGYLELYSGLERRGLRDLERAASSAPPESVIGIFPDLVLGVRELPTLSREER